MKSVGTLLLLCCVAPVADLEAGGVPYTIFLPDLKVECRLYDHRPPSTAGCDQTRPTQTKSLQWKGLAKVRQNFPDWWLQLQQAAEKEHLQCGCSGFIEGEKERCTGFREREMHATNGFLAGAGHSVKQ